jgi:DNA modification methylase
MILADFYDADKDGIVADFFSGSGSTAVACAYYDIPFIAVEKNETYYKKSVTRLEDAKRQTKLISGKEMLKSVQHRG